MPRSNTNTTYGSVTRGFHWLTALLILAIIPLGAIANDLPYDTSEQLARKAWLFSLHKTLGIAVFLVALLRILWALTQTKPAPLHPQRKLETLAAETVHWLLYGSLVLVPLSGWIHHAATTGFAPIWWPLGQNLPLVPKSDSVAAVAAGLHWILGKVMIVSLILHVAGALKHKVVDKDATLRRMITGAPDLAPLPEAKHSRTPVLAATAVWVLTMAAGGAAGLYSGHSTPTPTPAALAEVSSDWIVQEGNIGIAVTQFGSTVEGSFADWTADIAFDPQVVSGPSGSVEVQIAITSLTLGSVTSQAMGPDFFDATQFDTATFSADLITGVDGYTAEGTLTIKGQTVPVTLPFRLSLVEDEATVDANLTLDRRSFGIGDNMNDESSLGFDVDVVIALTATRTAQ